MSDRIQNIGSVTGSNNLFINGNVVVNDEILPTIAAHLLRPEFEMLSLEARNVMKKDIDECVQKVLEQVVEKKLNDKLTEFSRPSTQWAFYSTLKGYTISETIEQREMMVDSMIDRILEKWELHKIRNNIGAHRDDDFMKQMEVIGEMSWSDTIERFHEFEKATIEYGKSLKPLMDAGLHQIAESFNNK